MCTEYMIYVLLYYAGKGNQARFGDFPKPRKNTAPNGNGAVFFMCLLNKSGVNQPLTFSNLSMNATSFSTPSMGMAL
jgi:hypothetical protein